ncbi:DUF3560 domain-containing protein [Mucilaginibacter sp. P25]|uniref:DUF3560 domain-containing protein n=1 Tax=unclassified Mucilaginibacter TaxID=2617802 RepID=UPI001FB367F5|nr:DUF3560 domain-containing protein [Mucilaginibacter sp. SMC90]UOE52257.1 DUF3560 domain-containing protein [Mucilaginibacter sp. SMC90]
MKHDFEERKENRIINAHRLAKKNTQEAESLYTTASEMASVIPMGQPILIGHHSEKRDRNYRNRISNKFQQANIKLDKAAYYQDKAKTIENNDAIFSDDPKALEKLNAKLNELKKAQEFMKSSNKCLRKGDKECFLKLEAASEYLWDELNKTSPGYGKGFAHFSLSNNNANIRRIQQRIDQLKKLEVKTAIDETINDIRIFENKEANHLQIIFPGKPDEITRKKLKSAGFRWSPREGAWQRHISRSAYLDAQIIVKNITSK